MLLPEEGPPEANATSSEILEDVLKRLSQLDNNKRNKILNVLNEQSKNTKTNERMQSSLEPSGTKKPRNGDASAQDEVEILDMKEEKMGTYKRKRSKCLSSRSTSSSIFCFYVCPMFDIPETLC